MPTTTTTTTTTTTIPYGTSRVSTQLLEAVSYGDKKRVSSQLLEVVSYGDKKRVSGQLLEAVIQDPTVRLTAGRVDVLTSEPLLRLTAARVDVLTRASRIRLTAARADVLVKEVQTTTTVPYYIEDIEITPYNCIWDDSFKTTNQWTFTGDGSYATVGEKLRLDTTYGNVIATSVPYVTGDFDVEVEVKVVTDPDEDDWSLKFEYYIDATHYAYIDFSLRTSSHLKYIYGAIANGGAENAADASRTNDWGKLRVKRSGTSVTTYYQDGSGSWVQLQTVSNINSSEVGKIKLYAVRWDNDPEVVGEFDNFLVTDGCENFFAPSTTTTTTITTTTSPQEPEAVVWGEKDPYDVPGDGKKWSTWSDGDGGTPVIWSAGESSGYGVIKLEIYEVAHSTVEEMPVGTKTITVQKDKYRQKGRGPVQLYVRGDSNTFDQDDVLPAWIRYTAPMTVDWKYGQVKVRCGTGFSTTTTSTTVTYTGSTTSTSSTSSTSTTTTTTTSTPTTTTSTTTSTSTTTTSTSTSTSTTTTTTTTTVSYSTTTTTGPPLYTFGEDFITFGEDYIGP